MYRTVFSLFAAQSSESVRKIDEIRSKSKTIFFRLFQQEHMARVISVSDDLATLNETDSNQFQRMGILAAFDSWERAKKFVENSF